MNIKKTISVLLIALFMLNMLAGCKTSNTVESPEPDKTQAENIIDHSNDVSWSDGFMIKDIDEGYVSEDVIGFYYNDSKEGKVVVNVPRDEVYSYVESLGNLPRTHHFESFMPENLHSAFSVIDYAISFGYSRIIMPTSEFDEGDIVGATIYIKHTFRVSESAISARTIKTITKDDGTILRYIFIAIPGLEVRGSKEKYLEAMSVAKEIVNSIPDGYTEYEKAVYLYKYLTDNVEYYYDDYYSNTSWSLLYDTLINHKTVCAGYTEALYVLYNLAGIDCYTVSGFVNIFKTGNVTDDVNGQHIWNIARIDGTYYNFDSTWDAGSDVCNYSYFAISDEDLQYYSERKVNSAKDDYCGPLQDSLFPRLDYDSTTDEFSSLASTLYIYNRAHSDPEALLKYLAPGFSKVGKDDTGNIVLTNIAYDSFEKYITYWMSEDVKDAIFDGVFFNDNGRLAYYVKEATAKPSFRLCSITDEDGKGKTFRAEVYRFDEKWNFERSDFIIKFGKEADTGHLQCSSISLADTGENPFKAK